MFINRPAGNEIILELSDKKLNIYNIYCVTKQVHMLVVIVIG